MKGRMVKLEEVHQRNRTASFCSIPWDLNDSNLLTSCTGNHVIFIHDVDHTMKPTMVFRRHQEGVTTVALNPNPDTLASGSIDHSVKLYGFPDGEFQSNVTRFTLSISSHAFNKYGNLLAAASDDDGIKMTAIIDSSISRVLKGHNGFRTEKYWKLSSEKSVHTLKSVAPKCDSDSTLLNFLSWSLDGKILTIPSLKNDIVMYDRDTVEKLFTLKRDHEKSVCFLDWSPSGKYIATLIRDSILIGRNLMK